MGLQSTKVSTAEESRNNQIQERMDERIHRRRDQRIVKLLLYGPGECGKTTILRRMMLIHGNNLKAQIDRFRPNICFNVIEGAAMTLHAAKIKYGLNFAKVGDSGFYRGPDGNKVDYVVSEEDKHHADIIQAAYRCFQNNAANCNLNEDEVFNPLGQHISIDLTGRTVVDSIKYFLDGNGFFNAVLKKRNEYALYENWVYFAERLNEYPEWGGEKWDPSNDDLLMSRLRTTGKNDFFFRLDNTQYQLIDIGGQRAERKKFFFLFTQMDCILFVGSMSDYDETLFEDPNENRLKETLRVWRNTVNHDAFKNTWIILFLNKFDQFQEKYFEQQKQIRPQFKTRHPAPTVEQEEGNSDCPKAKAWFQDVFMDMVMPQKRNQVRPYITSAMKNQNIADTMRLCVAFLVHKIIEGGQ